MKLVNKKLAKFLRPIKILEKTWISLDLLLEKEKVFLEKEDFFSLEQVLQKEDRLIKDIFDLNQIILSLKEDLIRQGYELSSFFKIWFMREKKYKENYLFKKEKIIQKIEEKKEKILEQTEKFKKSHLQTVRPYQSAFPVPKILNIQI